MESDTNSHPTDGVDPFTDPAELRERDGIPFTAETNVHEDRDHCSFDVAGRVVVGVEDDDGDLLTLVNRDLGVAMLPNATLAPGEDWFDAAREAVAGYTGYEVRLDSFVAVREVDHVVAGEDDHHATTQRVVFGATPVGGAVDDCKTDPESGSDAWVVEWTDGDPAGANPPEQGVRDDVELFTGGARE